MEHIPSLTWIIQSLENHNSPYHIYWYGEFLLSGPSLFYYGLPHQTICHENICPLRWVLFLTFSIFRGSSLQPSSLLIGVGLNS